MGVIRRGAERNAKYKGSSFCVTGMMPEYADMVDSIPPGYTGGNNDN